MASSLRIGQVVKGIRDVYVIAQKLHDQVWSARSVAFLPNIKPSRAQNARLRSSCSVKKRFRNKPPFLVLEYLELDALKASGQAKLSRQDIKFVARSVLTALGSLHAKGIAHTDIKPDNILLNLDPKGARVVEAKLADCGDAWEVGCETDPRGTAHPIAAAIFRSPQALLGLKWSTPTDIWSFGATASPPISLLLGRNFHIFKPPNISADDEEFPVHVSIQQARYFGPFPLTSGTYLDKEEETILAAIHIYIEEQDSRKPFSLVEDKELMSGDKEILCRVMELDQTQWRGPGKGVAQTLVV
ncbi:hypothetical protein CERZMDRAFT_36105 [Cercospora zeae-maydis SCOH1-5]|uniref:Protein kinase domain-containing protein n=1 Tax=Cercospora zeae-maydis SCOH1-5 TaxID=717836 RepID=A0A6A6FPN5_9PEZI|nr:hypothetical protein CERZMDRAFT_36105 [Cercospora zeae-maydis SCOH1-5]